MMIPNDAHWLMMVPRISNWGVTALITRLLLGCITHAFGGPRSLAANVFKVFNVKRKTVESYMLKKKNEATLEKWGICSLGDTGSMKEGKSQSLFPVFDFPGNNTWCDKLGHAVLHPAPIQGRLFFVSQFLVGAFACVLPFCWILEQDPFKGATSELGRFGKSRSGVQDKLSDHVRTCKNAIEHLWKFQDIKSACQMHKISVPLSQAVIKSSPASRVSPRVV